MSEDRRPAKPGAPWNRPYTLITCYDLFHVQTTKATNAKVKVNQQINFRRLLLGQANTIGNSVWAQTCIVLC